MRRALANVIWWSVMILATAAALAAVAFLAWVIWDSDSGRQFYLSVGLLVGAGALCWAFVWAEKNRA